MRRPRLDPRPTAERRHRWLEGLHAYRLRTRTLGPLGHLGRLTLEGILVRREARETLWTAVVESVKARIAAAPRKAWDDTPFFSKQ